MVEKHFTLSRKDKGPDSEFSLEPSDLKKLCNDTKEAWLSLGKGGFKRSAAKESNKIFRRSLYFVKNLPIGHIIKNDDIRRIRPGLGISPKYFDQVIGKKTTKKIIRGKAVKFEDFN